MNVLESHFDKPTSEEFWHYCAKHKSSEGFYAKKEPLEKRMAEIQKKIGDNGINKQTYLGWTPLHVAILNRNLVAARFFINQGARTDLQDDGGLLPVDYAQAPEEFLLLDSDLLARFRSLSGDKKQQAMIDLVVSKYVHLGRSAWAKDPYLLDNEDLPEYKPPSVQEGDVNKIIQAFFPAPLSRSSNPFTYQSTTNDFGIVIKRLLFACQQKQATDIDIRTGFIIHGMRKIAQHEGFEFTLTNHFLYPRDHFVKRDDGLIVLLGYSPHSEHEAHEAQIKSAVGKTYSKAAYFQEKITFTTRLLCFGGYLGASLIHKSLAYAGYQHHFNSEVPSMLPYIEGGNFFTLTNSSGRRTLLLGQDHLTIIHAQYRSAGAFKDLPIPEIEEDLSEDYVRRVAEEMYAMGMLKYDKKEGLLTKTEIEESLSEYYAERNNKRTFREIAREKGLTLLPRDIPIKKLEPMVAKYLGQQKQVYSLLANHFNVNPEDIHFIPQVLYHLDVFIKPGPHASLFLQDFDTCIQVLEKMQKNHHGLGLDTRDMIMLGRYLDVANELKEKLGPSLTQAKDQLEQAGFTVIPAPGVFYDQNFSPNLRSHHFNFLNGISGWSESQKRYYYITTGAQVGPRLGSIFMKMFEQFLKQHESNMKVHFVGENPDKKGDFSQVMELWNQVEKEGTLEIGTHAGVHCLSFEQTAEDHSSG